MTDVAADLLTRAAAWRKSVKLCTVRNIQNRIVYV